jgi:hypothetical protein
MLVVRTHRPAPGRRFALLLFAIALGVAFQTLSPFFVGRASAQSADPAQRQIAFAESLADSFAQPNADARALRRGGHERGRADD